MKTSRTLALPWTLGFPGRRGAYSERAAIAFARTFAAADLEAAVHCAGPTFLEAWKWRAGGGRRAAVLPLYNLTAGFVLPTCELLAEAADSGVFLLGTTTLPIQHALLALPGTQLGDIQRVRSHPQALAQCSERISKDAWATEAATNTAVAAAEVAAGDSKTIAAIAHPATAEELGLVVLATDIQDRADNATTFGLFVESHGVTQRLIDEPFVVVRRPLQPEHEAHLLAFDVEKHHRVELAGTTLLRLKTENGAAGLTKALAATVVGDYSAFSAAKARALS